jgi:hypothetical protein
VSGTRDPCFLCIPVQRAGRPAGSGRAAVIVEIVKLIYRRKKGRRLQRKERKRRNAGAVRAGARRI